ncbi:MULTISPECIES: NAD(P)H-binding protein [unclassified Carboxylicivirga]|uniref:NAD(P)H-binding protein n=1 Tax=Carboxylicivirga TaxID=1628153 RepID=UPI003D336435
MKRALIAGASGLVGQALLTRLLNSSNYAGVHALVRRHLPISHPKLTQELIQFKHLDRYSGPETFEDVFCCLGTTIKKAGSKKAFTEVDQHHVVRLGRWAKKQQCQRFLVISSVGANAQAANFYLCTKGQMENELRALQLPTLHIFRPSLLLGDRREFRLAEKLSEKAMYLLKPFLQWPWRKYRAIKASDVAEAMYRQAQDGRKGVWIYEGAKLS